MSDLVLAQLVYGNYCGMWRAVGALAPSGSVFSVEQRPDMLLVRSNLTQRVPHMVLEPRLRDRVAEEWVAGLVRELANGPTALLVGMPPGTEEGTLAQALEAEGFLRGSKPQFSMTRVLDQSCAGPPDADIFLARTDTDLEEARALLGRIFGLPSAVFTYYTPPAIINTYVLRLAGAIVGAGCLCPFAGSAGIYSIAIVPTLRGRGYGRRMVRHVLTAAVERGMTTAVLSCEGQLARFYQGLGFTTCWTQRTYWLEAWWR
jgi:ribosomal protein S18 acetylase RimI-like enzyme